MTRIAGAGPSARAPLFLALGCVGFLSSPALAEDVQSDVRNPDDIVVTGERQAQDVESPKTTAPLLDTPQTVTVISDQTIRRQNLLTLRDALATVPGITFGAGEGGGGYGDSINLRGYSANNDITQDGVRDCAQYSRTDPFNLQQIEVYNGANSVFNGSGSVGGTINLVSKIPQADDLGIVSAALGTDHYYRATADINQRVSDLIAVRLNAMWHRSDVPGRDVEEYRRWGVAPSITFGIAAPTSLTLAFVHQRDDNTPVYGVPYFLNQLNDGPLPGADDSDYFGYRNLDAQELTVDRLTATFRHDFSDAVSIRNLTRWQRVHAVTATSAPQGIFCLASTGRQPVPADATATIGLACPAGLAPGFWLPSGPRGRVRDQINELIHSQTDLRIETGRRGALRNTLVIGGSLTWEDYSIETAELARNPDGSAFAPLPIESISNPATIYAGPINYTRHRSPARRCRQPGRLCLRHARDRRDGRTERRHKAGARRGDLRQRAARRLPAGHGAADARRSSPRRSTRKPSSPTAPARCSSRRPNMSIYIAYGNSRTPSSATVRLGCGVIAAPGAADPCAVGAGTGAHLRDRRQGRPARPPAAADRRPVPQRAQQLPRALPATPFNRRCRCSTAAPASTGWRSAPRATSPRPGRSSPITPGSTARCGRACPISACRTAASDPQAGDVLIQTPRHSGSLFTTYRLPFGLQLGYGFTYQSGFATYQRNAALAHAIFHRRFPDPPPVRLLRAGRRLHRAAQRPESLQRALLHQRPQQCQRDHRRGHRRLGDPRRGPVGGGEPVLFVLTFCAPAQAVAQRRELKAGPRPSPGNKMGSSCPR